MINNYSGNRKPFIAVLCSDKDQKKLLPILEKIQDEGKNLCLLSEKSKLSSALKKTCGVIAVISESLLSSSKLVDAVIMSDSLGKEIVPVKFDGCDIPSSIDRILMSRNMIFADNFSNDEDLTARIMTANVIKNPFITKQQQTGMKITSAAAIAAAAVVVISTVLGVVKTQQEKNSLPDFIKEQGITREDLEKITYLVYVGDESFEVIESSSAAYDSGNFPEGSHEWRNCETNQVISRGTITDFSFLNYCTNLRSLSLINQSCEQFPDLSSLEKLNTVEIIDCEFKDLNGLSSLPVTSLIIEDVPLTDINFISTVPVISLELTDMNNLQSLGDVSLDALKNITVRRGNFSNLSALENAACIEYAVIEDLGISDLSFLGNLSSLSHLEICACRKITSLKILEKTSSLYYIDLIDLPDFDGDLSCLKNHPHIRHATIGCRANDIDFLDNLSSAYNFEMSLSSDFHGDYSKLSSVTSYQYLNIDLWNRDFSDIAPALEVLNVSNVSINGGTNVDLSRLPPKAIRIELSGCDIENLQGIIPVSLISLIGINSLTSLDGIEQSNANEVSIIDCIHIEDYSALYDLKLSNLVLNGLINLPDFSKLNFLRGFSVCLQNIYGMENIDFIKDIPEKCMAGFTLSTRQDDAMITDLSALEGFNEELLSYSKITVPSYLEEHAKQLVNDNIFSHYAISDNNEYWEHNITLSSLDELDSFPDTVLAEVKELNLWGDMPFSWSQYDTSYDLSSNRDYLYSRNDERVRIYPEEGTLKDFTRLKKLTGLGSINIMHQPLESLEGIQYMQDLETLCLNGCANVSDFSAMYTLNSLEYLCICDSNIESLDGISNLQSLKHLEIQWCININDLTPLIKMENLEEVYVNEQMQEAIESLEGKNYNFNLIIY